MGGERSELDSEPESLLVETLTSEMVSLHWKGKRRGRSRCSNSEGMVATTAIQSQNTHPPAIHDRSVSRMSSVKKQRKPLRMIFERRFENYHRWREEHRDIGNRTSSEE
jgi:hypothetical protein